MKYGMILLVYVDNLNILYNSESLIDVFINALKNVEEKYILTE